MSGEINRVPSGLLNLLDLAARGQNPRALSPQLAATLDVGPLYLQQLRRSTTGASSNLSATATWSCNIVVPQSEIWWVHGFSVRGTAALAAGTTYRLLPVIRPGPSGTESQGVGQVEQFTTGERIFVSARDVPFLVPPGGDFLVYVCQATLGTAQGVVGLVDYTPLAI